jgi:mRNA interferase MazF
MSASQPERGDVFKIDLEVVRGHEQGDQRPAVVVSHNRLNHSRSEMLIIVPITKQDKPYPQNVKLEAGDGGLTLEGYALCEQIRAVSTDRIRKYYGKLSDEAMNEISDRLYVILDLEE